LLEAVSVIEVMVCDPNALAEGNSKVLEFVDAVADSVRRHLEEFVDVDVELRTKLDVAELVLASVVGILRDRLLSSPDGLDHINDVDCRAWLSRNGASDRACNSGFVQALYDMAFADAPLATGDKPGIAAGQALRGAFRMFFTYRGALFWKMRGGMGDVVFAPLYELLKAKGVKFKFFHKLLEVKIQRSEEDDPYVSELVFDKQVDLGDAEYDPLDADGCWPSQSLADEVSHPSPTAFEAPYCRRGKDKWTAKVQHDFDFVVLGVSVEAIKETCQAIIESNRRWERMVTTVKTIATQALQIWMDKGMEELGWPHGPVTLAGIPAEFDTWSDMTHVVPQEKWRTWPKAVAYFCSALPPDDQELGLASSEPSAQAVAERVRERARAFLTKDLPRLWASSGELPIISQFTAANINPSDRYVLSRPGSLAARISPLDRTYDNLTIAGDWTDCGFNEGCVEAAVMSGLLATRDLRFAQARGHHWLRPPVRQR